jgi:hypothetical protein
VAALNFLRLSRIMKDRNWKRKPNRRLTALPTDPGAATAHSFCFGGDEKFFSQGRIILS